MHNIARVVMVVVGLQFSLTSSLWAFAVGEITVYSRRGDPFAAEVRLLLAPHERDKEVEVHGSPIDFVHASHRTHR